MTHFPVSDPITAEQIAFSLAYFGEDPTLDRIEQLREMLAHLRTLDGGSEVQLEFRDEMLAKVQAARLALDPASHVVPNPGEPATVLRVGDTVRWRGNFGAAAAMGAIVTSIELCEQPGAKDGVAVEAVSFADRNRIVVVLKNGAWAYGSQIDAVAQPVKATPLDVPPPQSATLNDNVMTI